MTFLQSIKSKLQYFWANHVQKTFGSIIAALAGFDLVSSIAGYDHEIITLIGEKKTAAIHLIAGVIVALRASLHKKAS